MWPYQIAAAEFMQNHSCLYCQEIIPDLKIETPFALGAISGQ
jgi:hypothetical protein